MKLFLNNFAISNKAKLLGLLFQCRGSDILSNGAPGDRYYRCGKNNTQTH